MSHAVASAAATAPRNTAGPPGRPPARTASTIPGSTAWLRASPRRLILRTTRKQPASAQAIATVDAVAVRAQLRLAVDVPDRDALLVVLDVPRVVRLEELHAPPPVWAPPLHMLAGRGLYDLEIHKGQNLRWTMPSCCLSIDAGAGNYLLTVDTAALRGSPAEAYIRSVQWNDHSITPVEVDGDCRYIHWAIRQEWCRVDAAQELVLESTPLRPDNSEDQRRLGIPIISIALRLLPTADLDVAEIHPLRSSSELIRRVPSRGRRPFKVVSVNTTDVGGGAERSAWTIFRGLRETGVESWMLVGEKRSDDPWVLPMHSSPYIDYRQFQTGRPQFIKIGRAHV